jgi:hypothetical protein
MMVLILELGGIKNYYYLCIMKSIIKKYSVGIAIITWFVAIITFAYFMTK